MKTLQWHFSFDFVRFCDAPLLFVAFKKVFAKVAVFPNAISGFQHVTEITCCDNNNTQNIYAKVVSISTP